MNLLKLIPNWFPTWNIKLCSKISNFFVLFVVLVVVVVLFNKKMFASHVHHISFCLQNVSGHRHMWILNDMLRQLECQYTSHSNFVWVNSAVATSIPIHKWKDIKINKTIIIIDRMTIVFYCWILLEFFFSFRVFFFFSFMKK